MPKLNTGDRVKITGCTSRYTPVSLNTTVLERVKYKEPKEAILLGKSKRYTGTVRYDNWDSPGYLSVEESFDVWMVQLIDKNNRFRLPKAVFEDQIEK